MSHHYRNTLGLLDFPGRLAIRNWYVAVEQTLRRRYWWGLGGLRSAVLVDEPTGPNATGSRLLAVIHTPQQLEALMQSLDVRVSLLC
jgi:hypothetical protein